MRAGAAPSAAAGDPAETFALVAELARMRRGTPALWRGAYAELWRPNGGANAWVYARHDDDELLIVALNASNDEIAIEVPLAPSALPEAWESRLGEALLEGIRGPEATVRDGGLNLRIPARGSRILRLPGDG